MSTSADTALIARAAALKLLEAALGGRSGLDEALNSAGQGRLSDQDRAFARAVVMATLRHLGPIDRALDARLGKEPPKPSRDLLRLGLAQAVYLDTPVFAAVDTTVSLAPKPLRGLINAVLRGVLRDGPLSDDPETLAPPWLFARWRAAYGEAEARAIAACIAVEPATDLTLRDASDTAVVADLEGQVSPTGGVRTERRGDVAGWPGYGDGRWWVQDAAAALPARLLAIEAGQTALDLCAAPGGKTLQLAAAGARVTALDRSADRLRRVVAGLARTGLTAEVVAAGAVGWADARAFDAVLLDAPCSATGTFRRHPDVLWNARPGDIASLAGAQAALLAAAAAAGRARRPAGLQRLLARAGGGRGADHAAFWRAMPGSRSSRSLPARPVHRPRAGNPKAGCGSCLIRPAGGLDGFFIARLRRARP